MSWVLGIDAAKQGWVVVALRREEFHSAFFYESFADAVKLGKDAAVIAVDMPVGLSGNELRRCDTLAREFVGPRRASVFVTPPRAALEADTYAVGVNICKELTGVGFSKQAWSLKRRILEVAELASQDARIYEVHPEVSFAAMHGEPLPFPKTSWNGQVLRRRLLANNAIALPDDLGSAGAVPTDDVLDAAAAAWSARRIEAGRALTIPGTSHGERGSVIWF